MSEIKLSRAQRREIQKLAMKVDKATASDRRFFERFPHRQHRIRRAHSAEVQQEEIARCMRWIHEPGYRAFAVIRNLCSGARLRMLIQGSEDADADIGEAAARDIYEQFETGETRQVEAEMRAISCKGAVA